NHEHHRAYDGEILRIDRIDQKTAQAGYGKVILQDDTAQNQQRQREHDPGENGHHGVFQHMTKQNRVFTEALGAGGADIVLVHFFEKDRSVKTHFHTNAKQNADDNRHDDKANGGQAVFITRNGENTQFRGHHVLPENDVKQLGYG